MKSAIEAIGIMSGTSLDGLDIALCRFGTENEQWDYQILKAETFPYPAEWLKKLSELHQADALSISLANTEYGVWIGQRCNQFLAGRGIKPQLIASHGHTIFHRPDKKMTLQIGSGAAIAAETGLLTVCDFRSQDVALGGNGAPLVPIGDRLLFGDFLACINIGGFANISFENEGERLAWDICPANFILNREAGKLGRKMDESGLIARSGRLNQQLLQQLNNLPYYILPYPKSLGREWVESQILPMLANVESDTASVLRTLVEHIAIQISGALPVNKSGNILITGGGAHNRFLIERIRSLSQHKIMIPDKETVDFKEALIFALLGVLRIKNKHNCLASVTGASRDNCGGAVYYPGS